jgi:hypothetical protein
MREREAEVREAIARSKSWAESLRRLGYCSTGGNWLTLKKYAALWQVSTAHFDPQRAQALARRSPLEEVLARNSTVARKDVKRRLFQEKLKEPRCELCGQGEEWRGRQMSLILDHINGIRDDHRLENLRIVCPNCAATLDTHCGRKNRLEPRRRSCRRCGARFDASRPEQRYCSRQCGSRWDRSQLRGIPQPQRRKVKRPPYEQLVEEIQSTSYLAVGRKYGVSDAAIRKWLQWYEREAERNGKPSADPPTVGAASRT